MATLANNFLTLADKMKRQNANLEIAMIIETLSEFTSLIEDAPARECNNGSRHRTTMRTQLPAISWRILNQGIAETKSGTAQVEDTTGFMEAWSRVDAKLVDLEGDGPAFRLSESRAFLQAMAQEAEDSLFYANTNTDPEEILGLAPRFNDLSAANGGQIVDAGGTGSDNHSMWMITWGEDATTLLYPKGTTAGMTHEDLGLDTVLDASGNPFRAYRDRYVWDLGLSVRDFRSIARVANIDNSLLTNDVSTGANLIDQLIEAEYRMNDKGVASGKTVIYANNTCMKFLDFQSRRQNSNIHLTWQEAGPDSKPVLHFRDKPIRRTDALLNGSEARVT